MGNGDIEKLTMPKWGLAMTHGKVVEWLIPEGADVAVGTAVIEIETEKITGTVEAVSPGILRRHVAEVGQEIPVAGLLGVVAASTVSDDEINQLVEEFSIDLEEVGATNEGPSLDMTEVGDLQLCSRQCGEGGQPIVLIHGFGGDLNSWLFNQVPWSSQRAVYSLDLPGHGRSTKEVGDGTLETLVASVRDWLDAVSLSTVHLVGHSLGGAIALSLALQHPDRVQSCTLIASAGLGTEIDAQYIRGFVESDRRKQLKGQLEKLFFDSGLVTRQFVDEALKYKRLDGVRSGLEGIASQLLEGECQRLVLRQHLEQVTVPLSVIWGAEDLIIPQRHAEGLPDSVSAHVIENSGHMVHMEAAGEVNRRVDEFLAECDAV